MIKSEDIGQAAQKLLIANSQSREAAVLLARSINDPVIKENELQQLGRIVDATSNLLSDMLTAIDAKLHESKVRQYVDYYSNDEDDEFIVSD